MVNIQTTIATQIDITPYTWLTQLAINPVNGNLVCVASSPGIPDQIIRLDGARWQVAAHSTPATLDPTFLPNPVEFTWSAENDTPVHGLYYPPTNPKYEGSGLPPALVYIHGGPTSISPNRLTRKRLTSLHAGMAM